MTVDSVKGVERVWHIVTIGATAITGALWDPTILVGHHLLAIKLHKHLKANFKCIFSISGVPM